MPSKPYTPISPYWFTVVPAVVLGLGYYLWHSHSFIAMELRQALSPIVSFVAQLFDGLV
ncbi:MAG: hypothetical protein O3A53_07080 [Acidobacteria bacterium]|nr:hypothetical protein [Acidobacteriota bacterium]MDA1234547.1 hypothetical protein [Acidobacteriota bacterium]